MDEESSLRLQIDYVKQKWLNEQYGMVESDGPDTLTQIRKLKRQLYEFKKNKDLETLKNSSSVTIGKDIETGQPLRLGNVERRSGLYILGKSGMGKSVLLVNIMNQHIKQGRGMFFLDPHGDAITDLLTRGDNHLIDAVRLFDPQDEQYSFGINLLSCRDVNSLTERMDTYTRAYNVFYKLWENEWGPWLQLILQNTLHAFIENQDYTLAEVPMFLNPRNSAFRNHIIGNIKHNPAVVDFWRDEFFERRDRDQQERVDAALTRVTTLLTHPYVRDIIGQKTTTIDFSYYLKYNTILLFKLAASLSVDIKKFIGTILISELLHAARNRLEKDRYPYGIFVDEFQNFTSSDDFATLITEARKFGIATTIAHVERFGQFANNQKLLGATLAAANKVLFQLTVKDAEELAPEFAKEPTTTETRLEPGLVISQEPFWDLLRRGHANRQIMELVRKHFQYLLDSYQKLREEAENVLLTRADYQNQAELQRDEASITGIDERRRRAIYETLSKESEWFVATGRDTPISLATLEKTEASLERAMGLHNLAHRQTRLLQHYYNAIKGLRERFQDINRYMVAVMEGRTEPEPRQEPYVSDFIDLFSKELIQAGHADVIGLYLKLKFKNPESLQIIPIYLIAKHWPEQIKKPIPLNPQAIIKFEDIVAARNGTYIIELDDYTKDWHKSYLERGEDPINRWDRPLSDPPPRRLTASERELFMKVCIEDLLTDPNTPLQKLNDYIELFTLLRQPENLIKVPSGQYIEKPVSVRLVSDMTNEMAQELSNLPRLSAWAKVIDENKGEQIVLKRKIQTLPLPPLQKPQNGEPDIESRAIENGHRLCKERVQIEKEIHERQERWQSRSMSHRPPPPAEEPPRGQARRMEPPKPEGAPAKNEKSSADSVEPIPAPLLAPLPPSQPTPTLELLGSLTFCISGESFTWEELRHDYNNCFPLRLAQNVNCGVEMRNLLYKQRDKTYRIEMRYYNPDGLLMGTLVDDKYTLKSDSDWGGKYTDEREGIANSGSWIPGTIV